jgi:hypothetical protein
MLLCKTSLVLLSSECTDKATGTHSQGRKCAHTNTKLFPNFKSSAWTVRDDEEHNLFLHFLYPFHISKSFSTLHLTPILFYIPLFIHPSDIVLPIPTSLSLTFKDFPRHFLPFLYPFFYFTFLPLFLSYFPSPFYYPFYRHSSPRIQPAAGHNLHSSFPDLHRSDYYLKYVDWKKFRESSLPWFLQFRNRSLLPDLAKGGEMFTHT